MISSRFSLPVVLILTLALVPTVIHNYLGLKIDDGKSVTKVSARLGAFTSEPTNRKAQWVKEIFDSNDWFERSYRDQRGSQIRLFAARSYDHKRLYHHPELALSYGQNFKNDGIVPIQLEQQKIPVHILRHTSGKGVSAYVLYYDGTFIENPITHQVLDSLNLLVSGRKQLTIFYLSDHNNTGGAEAFAGSPAAIVLVDAIKSFLSQSDD